MNQARWQQIEDLFQRVSACDPGQWESVLAEACVGDEELRCEVKSLLECTHDDDAFLDDAIQGTAEMAACEHSVSLVGSRIGAYRLTSLIGRGGMGSVYRAERYDAEFQKEVALKLVKSGLDSEADVRRFRRERQILARLDHPYIARLLDGGPTEEGLPFFVMELVEGLLITEYARQLPIRHRLDLFRRVCSAVEYAHRNLVVHRDLKPGNILVTADGTPKLLDFGIAHLLSAEESGHTQTAVRILTPHYASPEQKRGEPVTTSTDVYSLGIVLQELLPNETGELAQIVEMARHEDVDRRYRSVEQLSEDIRRYLEGLPVLARKDTILYRARKFVRRYRVAVVASVLAAMSLVTGTVVAAIQAQRAEHRLNELRKFARSVIFDREITNNLRTLKAREKLASNALAYLDSAARESSGNQGLALELAEGYEVVAAIQGGTLNGSAGLGARGEARISYEKAAAILNRLSASGQGDGRLALRAAIVNIRVGELTPDLTAALIWHRRALEIAEPRYASGDQTAWNAVKRAHIGIGLAQLRSGDPRAAAETLTAILKRMSPNEGLIALGGLGAAHHDRGDLEAAAKIWKKWIEDDLPRILGPHANDASVPQVVRGSTGAVLVFLGDLYANPYRLNLGEPARGLEYLNQARPALEEFVRRNPEDSEAESLGRCYASLGAIYRDRDPALALEFYRKAIPLVTGSMRADYRAEMAYPLRKLKRHEEGVSHIEQALNEDRSPTALNQLGDLYLERGDGTRAALAAYREARERAEKEVAAKPYYMPARRTLADAHEGIARVHEIDRDWNSARAFYASSLAVWQQWTQWGVSSSYNVHRQELVSAKLNRFTRKVSRP